MDAARLHRQSTASQPVQAGRRSLQTNTDHQTPQPRSAFPRPSADGVAPPPPTRCRPPTRPRRPPRPTPRQAQTRAPAAFAVGGEVAQGPRRSTSSRPAGSTYRLGRPANGRTRLLVGGRHRSLQEIGVKHAQRRAALSRISPTIIHTNCDTANSGKIPTEENSTSRSGPSKHLTASRQKC